MREGRKEEKDISKKRKEGERTSGRDDYAVSS